MDFAYWLLTQPTYVVPLVLALALVVRNAIGLYRHYAIRRLLREAAARPHTVPLHLVSPRASVDLSLRRRLEVARMSAVPDDDDAGAVAAECTTSLADDLRSTLVKR